jgi:hypothetical protein
MRRFWSRMLAVAAIITGVAVGASALPANAAPVSTGSFSSYSPGSTSITTGSPATPASASDVWWS